MQKMNVIAEIRCYFERSVVTLILRKDDLNTVTYNTPVLLCMKTEQFNVQNAILCQHICNLQTFKKQSGFWPTLHVNTHENYKRLKTVQILAHPIAELYTKYREKLWHYYKYKIE